MENVTPPPLNRVRNELHTGNDNTPIKIPETPAMTKLGYGTGVSVYSLTRSPTAGSYRSPWAIKKINRASEGSVTEFDKRIKYEAEILKNLNHPNIVGFRALTETRDGRKCLAMEECHISLGDLIDMRHDENMGPFPINIIYKVALDIANALHYLHTSRFLLHGDLKSANILTKDDCRTAKLCDFGVSLPLCANGTLDTDAAGSDCEYVGTACWSPPEALGKIDWPISSKCDIFSYGLIIWEMFTLQPPHISAVDDSGHSEDSFDEDGYQMRIGTRPPLPSLEKEYQPFVDIFTACTETVPTKRPSALDVIKMLESTNAAQLVKDPRMGGI